MRRLGLALPEGWEAAAADRPLWGDRDVQRGRALQLWWATLGLKEVPAGASGEAQLRPLWTECGLSESDMADLAAAVRAEDGLERRHQLVRRTRRLIQRYGFDPSILSIPAAETEAE
jgi:hypothetical protein